MVNRPPANQGPGQEQNNPQPDHNEAIARWTKSVALFTFFLFIASAVTDFFIYKQWQASVAAQEDSRKQLAAVVTYTGTNTSPANVDKDGNPQVYAFFPTFRNYGGTRTKGFTGWHSLFYFEGSVPFNQDFSKPFNQISPGNNIIGPGETFTVPPAVIATENVGKAFAKKGLIIEWGHFEWADIFNPDKIHVINYCVQQTPAPAPAPAYSVAPGAPTPPTPAFIMNFTPLPYQADCNNSS